MLISKRVQGIYPSQTLALVEMAAKYKDMGYSIVSLAVGEPDFDTPPNIIEAACKAMHEGKTHYTPPSGIKELREAIADKYRKENNVKADADNIIVTPAKLAIFNTLSTFVDPGDEVLLPDPGWVSYKEMVRFARGKPVGVKLDETKNWRMSIDDLLAKVSFKTKVLIINSPANPTGAMLTHDDLKAIRDIVEDFDLILISDEIYEKIIFEGKHISPAEFEDLRMNTIVVNGFSKGWAMTGWRIGYMIAPHRYIPELEKIQQHTISCAPSMAQYAAVEALKTRNYVMEMVSEFKKRRDYVYNRLSSMEGINVERPQATFYIFPRYDYDIPSKKLAEDMMKKEKVAITPGFAFGNNGEYHLRISFATSMENLKEGLERLEHFLGKL